MNRLKCEKKFTKDPKAKPRPLEYLCRTCKEVECERCSLAEHTGVKDLKCAIVKLSELGKSDVDKFCNELAEKINRALKAVKNWEAKQKSKAQVKLDRQRKTEDLCRQIDDQFALIQEAIKNRQNHLIAQVKQSGMNQTEETDEMTAENHQKAEKLRKYRDASAELIKSVSEVDPTKKTVEDNDLLVVFLRNKFKFEKDIQQLLPSLVVKEEPLDLDDMQIQYDLDKLLTNISCFGTFHMGDGITEPVGKLLETSETAEPPHSPPVDNSITSDTQSPADDPVGSDGTESPDSIIFEGETQGQPTIKTARKSMGPTSRVIQKRYEKPAEKIENSSASTSGKQRAAAILRNTKKRRRIVSSSTDSHVSEESAKSSVKSDSKRKKGIRTRSSSDNSEVKLESGGDWWSDRDICAVCREERETEKEIVCVGCKFAFHPTCHIVPFDPDSLEKEEPWYCGKCAPVVSKNKKVTCPQYNKNSCGRILLRLFCFSKSPREFIDGGKGKKDDMTDLSKIRRRLCTSNKYLTAEPFAKDIKHMLEWQADNNDIDADEDYGTMREKIHQYHQHFKELYQQYFGVPNWKEEFELSRLA